MNKIIGKLAIFWACTGLILVMGCTPTTGPAADSAPAAQREDPTPIPPTPIPAPATQLGERIEVAEAGFSVQPPANYLVERDDLDGVQMLESEAAEETGPGIAVFGGEFGDDITADEMYQFMIEADDMLENVVRSPLDDPDSDGFVVEFESQEGDVAVKGKIILTLMEGQGTIVTAGAPAEAWANGFSDVVDAVAASIEMFPPEVE